MNTKFTPGPWQRADLEHAWDEIIGNIDGDYDDERGVTCTYTRICEIQDGAPISEQQANARLIAASPDLLDAARRASFAMADAADADFMGDEYHESIAGLRAAIAKATGETA